MEVCNFTSTSVDVDSIIKEITSHDNNEYTKESYSFTFFDYLFESDHIVILSKLFDKHLFNKK